MITDESFEMIESDIENFGWYRFGKKTSDCPGEVTDGMIEFFRQEKELPKPCDKCYKALIFWDWCYSKENTSKFLEMVKSFDFPVRGKFDRGVAVFYFVKREEMLEFLEILKKKMEEFSVEGKPQWRRACKEYQNRVPEYWKNAKELVEG